MRMPVKAPPAPVVAVYNWTGFYIGVNVGYSWGRQTNSLFNVADEFRGANKDHLNGVIGGGQIGYNWQAGQWVFGLEADFQGSGQKDSGSFFLPFAIPNGDSLTDYTPKLEWFGTVRARIGYAMGASGNWLPYVTGGWAYGHGAISGTGALVDGSLVLLASPFKGSHDYSGWTVGGGLEWALDRNWRVKLEYLYIDFGHGPTVQDGITNGLHIVGGRLTDNIVRGGINYRFGGGPY
jgi:outer membrane immunogenic protein